ncbi:MULTISPECIES: SigE family RNA polymerase sigma factor [Streptomyces]|uniref:SigE family RNA polymerase sigma factor n=1 Tax=Streptomyces TaxID=1883 RepID=UPI001C2ED83E|nr:MULTISPECIES: SigE family RNA polymerase sigma factor [Streptomyces]MBV1948478.1 SigE family RNA polymerase sigma factor [Streptomyces sp. BV129]BDH06527.1 RNA polymerase sigma24 factor [Streptomyces seoulensis]
MASTAVREYQEFAVARGAYLFRTACLLTGGDRYLAEDLVQETLAKMYCSWRRINRIDSPVAYANTVLTRTFLSHCRRRSSKERPSDRIPETADRADDTELRLTLLEGLARLSANDRAVLVLRYWEDRSVEETAEVLRVSPGAVRVRSLRALGRLRALLGDQLAELALR